MLEAQLERALRPALSVQAPLPALLHDLYGILD